MRETQARRSAAELSRSRLRLLHASRMHYDGDSNMVFAVQCPNPKCRKYMLVEEKDRGGVVQCLICKASIRLGKRGEKSNAAGSKTPTENSK